MLNQVAPEPTDVELRASARMTKNGGDNTTSSTRRVPVQLRALTGKQLYCRYWVPSDPPRYNLLLSIPNRRVAFIVQFMLVVKYAKLKDQ